LQAYITDYYKGLFGSPEGIFFQTRQEHKGGYPTGLKSRKRNPFKSFAENEIKEVIFKWNIHYYK
jgi:hypothetical protein